jgi:hypothetical protein
MAVVLGAAFVDDRAAARDERLNYVAVDGEIQEGASGDLVFTAQSDELGTSLELPVDGSADLVRGDRITVLVRRGDATDYLLPNDRAQPGQMLAGLVFATVAAVGAAAVGVGISRRRRGDAEPLRAVAATPPPGPPPGPLVSTAPLRRGTVAAQVATALALALLAATLGAAAVRAARRGPDVVTTEGVVRNGSDALGRPTLVVDYFDERQNGTNNRPLTPAELANGAKFGDAIPVTYRIGNEVVGKGDVVGWGGLGLLAALAALALGARAAAWPVRLRRARRTPPRAVDVVAWVRVVRGRTWLVVWPAGETRARKAVAVPLRTPGDLPTAIAGTIQVHGRLEGGRPAILREPGGAPLWPAGPARGAFWAGLTGVSVLPPLAPAADPAWAYAPPAG